MFAFGGIHGGSTTSGNRFLSPGSLRSFLERQGTIDSRAQRISDYNRCLTLYDNNGNNGLGTITNSHIPLAAPAFNLIFSSVASHRIASQLHFIWLLREIKGKFKIITFMDIVRVRHPTGILVL